jgi:putative colanic acid biosynthesis UDP-glucose lipid carrier transferase
MATRENYTCHDADTVSMVERITAAVFLVYFAPLMLALAVLVKIETRGPVLARRGGCMIGGKVVRFWEFRTMAAERAPCGIASRFASQYTPLGAFLRNSRLDLLPRLFNTLRGEVTFAGLLA